MFVKITPESSLEEKTVDSFQNNAKRLFNFFFESKANPRFDDLLITTGGVLAGSAALWIANPHCDAIRFTGDLDIWIQDSAGLERDHTVDFNKGYQAYKKACYENPNKRVLEAFVKLSMTGLGFERNLSGKFSEIVSGYDVNVDKNFKYINAIHTFTPMGPRSLSGNPRRVQIIYTSIPPVEMVGKFDLSVCQVYYNGYGEIYSAYPKHISRRVFQNFSPESGNATVREKKYVSRGYKKIDKDIVEDIYYVDGKEFKTPLEAMVHIGSLLQNMDNSSMINVDSPDGKRLMRILKRTNNSTILKVLEIAYGFFVNIDLLEVGVERARGYIKDDKFDMSTFYGITVVTKGLEKIPVNWKSAAFNATPESVAF